MKCITLIAAVVFLSAVPASAQDVSAASQKPAPASTTPTGVQGTWLGTLHAAGGINLRIQLHIERDAGGALAVKMDSLDQNVNGIPIPKATLTDSAFHFEFPSGGITYDGALNAAKGEITGTFTQAGVPQPLNFIRSDQPPPEPPRPQTPLKPYPYLSEDVSYPNPKTPEVTLAATFTLPRGTGPFPVALLICGTGRHDRDETLFGHKPFLVISDYLTRHGIAVLRYDKRGVAKSTGSYALATISDFAGDAEASLAYLKTRKEIDPHRIGLIGHSEGGTIAPLVASKHPDIAWVVLLAGTGIPGEEILLLQEDLIAKAQGVSSDDIDRVLAMKKRGYSIISAESDPALLKQKLVTFFATDGTARSFPQSAKEGLIQGWTVPWYRDFLVYDPVPALQNTKCPVLALNGEHDLQVPPKQDLSAIHKALQDGGNKDFQTIEIPGLNHLFQHSVTGAPSEYGTIEETFAPEALELMTHWIEKHSSH